MRGFLPVAIALSVTSLVGVTPAASASSPCRPHVVFTDESWRLGQFTAPDATSIADVKFVDVNGDGYPDLFVAVGTTTTEGRQNHLFINDRHGHFVDQTAERLPAILRNSTKVAFGDISGHGHMDAIVANAFGDSVGDGPHPPPTLGVQLLLNDGHGYFRDASDQLPKEPLSISSNVTLVDVNRDGRLDAVISNEFPFDTRNDHGAQSWLWMNDGHGHFTDVTATAMPKHTDQTSAAIATDLNGDGYPDLIMVNRGQKRAYINDRHGNFVEETSSRFPVTTEASRDATLARFAAGRPEGLLVANSEHDPLTFYQSDGRGHFTAVDLGIPQNPNELDTSLSVFRFQGRLAAFVSNAGQPTQPGHDFSGGQSRFFLDDGHGHFTDETAKYFPSLPSDPSLVAGEGVMSRHGGLPTIVVGNATDSTLPGGHYLRLYQAERRHC
jgi:hypothetical protein